MDCKCIDKLNKKLKEHNTELDTTFNVTGQVFMKVATRRIVSYRDNKRAVVLVPNYCPMCGKKVEMKTLKQRVAKAKAG